METFHFQLVNASICLCQCIELDYEFCGYFVSLGPYACIREFKYFSS